MEQKGSPTPYNFRVYARHKAAKKYFKFSKVIPCHYKTFPLLEQNAETLIKELGSDVVTEPEVMKPIEL